MGEEVGTMQFRVQGEQIKNNNEKKKKKKKMSIQKKRGTKKNMYEKRKKIKVNSPVLQSALGISKVSRFEVQTHFSNHVQPGNEDFLCASGSLFAICTSTYPKVCVFFSPPP
jgi:hypothetical protein